MRRARRGEAGFALFLAILLLLILTVIGIALLFTASTERSLSGNETKVSKDVPSAVAAGTPNKQVVSAEGTE